jgi:hypothetical protein
VQYGIVGIVAAEQFCLGGVAVRDQLVQSSWSSHALRHAAASATSMRPTDGVPLLPGFGWRVTSNADATGSETHRLTLADVSAGLLTSSENAISGVADTFSSNSFIGAHENSDALMGADGSSSASCEKGNAPEYVSWPASGMDGAPA